MSSPFPPLGKVYSLLLQEEAQCNLHVSKVKASYSKAMLAKNANYSKFKDKKKLRCSHSDGPGHTVDRCFQLIGYPLGWKGSRGQKVEKNSLNISSVNMFYLPKDTSDGNSGGSSNPLFTQEFFEQFLTFTKMKGEDVVKQLLLFHIKILIYRYFLLFLHQHWSLFLDFRHRCHISHGK